MKIKDIRKHARQLVRDNIGTLKEKARTGEDVYDDMDGGRQVSVYLGSILHLSPSGKVYTPYANSNVTPCPICKGGGAIPNKLSDPERYEKLQLRANSVRSWMIHHFGMACENRWPEPVVEKLAQEQRFIDSLTPTITCSLCQGLGSHEAYQDQEWQQALEDEACKHGAFITGSEGDGCDVLLAMAVEEELTTT